MHDEPLLSPGRLWGGLRSWFYYAVVDGGRVQLSLLHLLRFHRRPYAMARRQGGLT